MNVSSESPQLLSSGRNHAQDIEDLIARLASLPEREPVALELGVLRSIYGEHALRLWYQPSSNGDSMDGDGPCPTTIRYEVVLSLPSPHEDVQVRILVSLLPSYPASSPPQLQLLSRYIGAFGVDSGLFGSILRTFISANGVEWTTDTICVFDGLQNIMERCLDWYESRLNKEKMGELLRQESREQTDTRSESPELEAHVSENVPTLLAPMPLGCEIVEAEPITDRKSAFVGRACRITDPSQVPLILSQLMSDRRIARAAHPVINAWRCRVGALLHQDNDDDGETAAGGRLAHLLQILEVENVLVVVTRYFGGIHLGPDRFKHINQAARNALDLGGFLDSADQKRNSGRGKKS